MYHGPFAFASSRRNSAASWRSSGGGCGSMPSTILTVALADSTAQSEHSRRPCSLPGLKSVVASPSGRQSGSCPASRTFCLSRSTRCGCASVRYGRSSSEEMCMSLAMSSCSWNIRSWSCMPRSAIIDASALASAGASGSSRSALTALWCSSSCDGHVHAGVPGASHLSHRCLPHSAHVLHTGMPTPSRLLATAYQPVLHARHGMSAVGSLGSLGPACSCCPIRSCSSGSGCSAASASLAAPAALSACPSSSATEGASSTCSQTSDRSSGQRRTARSTSKGSKSSGTSSPSPDSSPSPPSPCSSVPVDDGQLSCVLGAWLGAAPSPGSPSCRAFAAADKGGPSSRTNRMNSGA